MQLKSLFSGCYVVIDCKSRAFLWPSIPFFPNRIIKWIVVDLAEIAAVNPSHCLLLDWLTLWLYIQTSKYSHHGEILAELGQSIEASLNWRQWILLSNELCFGIVPVDAESQCFFVN